MRTFLVLWAGQTTSVLGSSLTSFALNVWVYTSTGSVTRFAMMYFFIILPGLVLSPVVGALVDRWDRRWVMILSDSGSGWVTIAIGLLVYHDRLEVWHLYVLLAFSSLCSAFQYPAFSSTVTLLVAKKHLGRAAGMSQLGPAAAMVLAPLLAPMLLARIGLFGVILVDVVSFLFAVGSLCLIRFPRPPRSAEGSVEGRSLLQDSAFGWTYIRHRPGLLALLITFACGNLVMGFVQVLLTPIVLEMWSAAVLGRVLASASMGLVIGGLLMSLWAGPRHRVRWILLLLMIQGCVLMVGGPVPSALGLSIVAFTFMIVSPIIAASSQTIWQTKVEPDIQGRVFAIRRMIALVTMPVAYVMAGPLSDHVFEPLLLPKGPLAATVGSLVGVGPGRGTALFVSGLGCVLVLAAAVAFSYRPLRQVETDLPDAIADDLGSVR